METLRVKLQPKKKVWQKKTTVSFGLDEGETFYLNNDTGETQWDRPVEYFSEPEEDHYGNKLYMRELDTQTYHHILTVMRSFTALVQGNDKVNFDKVQLEQVLDCLNYLKHSTGENCEKAKRQWVECFIPQLGSTMSKKNHKPKYSLKTFYKVYSTTANKKTQSDPKKENRIIKIIACEIIINILLFLEEYNNLGGSPVDTIELKAKLLPMLVSKKWGMDYEKVCEISVLRLEALCLQTEDPPEHEATSTGLQWLWLLYGVFSFSPPLQVEALLKDKPKQATRPLRSLVVTLLKIIKKSTEEEFLAACTVYFAICTHSLSNTSIKKKHTKVPIMAQLTIELSKNLEELRGAETSLSEGLIYLLNEKSSGSSNKELVSEDTVLLLQILTTLEIFLIRDRIEYRTTMDGFFSVHDLNVMVDIFLLQINNLEPDNFFRVQCMEVLRIILGTRIWQKDRYKSQEIRKALEELLGANETLIKEARLAAKEMLTTYKDFLSPL